MCKNLIYFDDIVFGVYSELEGGDGAYFNQDFEGMEIKLIISF